MQFKNLDIIVPSLEPTRGYDEAALLGMAVWLWMRSAIHRRTPLYAIQNLLIPALKYRQFIIGREGETPVFYASWASFDLDSEERYVRSPKDLTDAGWRSGDRIWITALVAPFGHMPEINAFIRQILFPEQVFWALRHKPGDIGEDRIMSFAGIHRHREQPTPNL
jgi:cytolysin-activating lysine-acyltransferase